MLLLVLPMKMLVLMPKRHQERDVECLFVVLCSCVVDGVRVCVCVCRTPSDGEGLWKECSLNTWLGFNGITGDYMGGEGMWRSGRER